jgi:hypothetical protein
MDYRENEVEAGAVGLWNGGADFEALLGYMRERGVDQTDSYLILARVTGVDVGKAQKIVFQSKTWADRLESNIQLQNNLIQAIKELNEEDPNFKISFEFQPDPDESENESDESR